MWIGAAIWRFGHSFYPLKNNFQLLALRAGSMGASSHRFTLGFFMNKSLALRLAAIPAVVLASTGSAMAALPVEATAAITTAGADLLTAIGSVIAVMVAVWGLKKLGTKMGWF